MGEELRISAYGISAGPSGLNLDNIYLAGRYAQQHDETTTLNKVTRGEIQAYAVSDARTLARDTESAIQASDRLMTNMAKLEEELDAQGWLDKNQIWDFITDETAAIREEGAGGISFAGLFFQKNRGLVASLGDARVYVMRAGNIVQITKDQLAVQDLLENGVVSPEQADIYKRNSELTAYVGMSDIREMQQYAFSKYFLFYPGDVFLLCTDGISDTIRKEDLGRLARSLKGGSPLDMVPVLADRAAEKNPDDATVMVLVVEDVPTEDEKGKAPVKPAGLAAIPRTESYSTQKPAQPVQPAAPAAKPVEEKPARVVSMPKQEEPDEADDEEEEEKPGFFASLLGKLRRSPDDEDVDETYDGDEGDEEEEEKPNRFAALFKRRNRDEEEPDEDEYEEDEEDDEEEPGLIEQFRDQPRLIILAAVVLILIVLIIWLIAKTVSSGSRKQESKPEPAPIISEIESEPESEEESFIESGEESEEESFIESEVESEPESEPESQPEESKAEKTWPQDKGIPKNKNTTRGTYKYTIEKNSDRYLSNLCKSYYDGKQGNSKLWEQIYQLNKSAVTKSGSQYWIKKASGTVTLIMPAYDERLSN